MAERIACGDCVRVLRPLTVSSLHGRVSVVSVGGSRPYGVEIGDQMLLFLSADEIEWEADRG